MTERGTAFTGFDTTMMVAFEAINLTKGTGVSGNVGTAASKGATAVIFPADVGASGTVLEGDIITLGTSRHRYQVADGGGISSLATGGTLTLVEPLRENVAIGAALSIVDHEPLPGDYTSVIGLKTKKFTTTIDGVESLEDDSIFAANYSTYIKYEFDVEGVVHASDDYGQAELSMFLDNPTVFTHAGGQAKAWVKFFRQNGWSRTGVFVFGGKEESHPNTDLVTFTLKGKADGPVRVTSIIA